MFMRLQVVIWDQQQIQQRMLLGHPDEVLTCCSISVDDAFVVVGGADGSLYSWDVGGWVACVFARVCVCACVCAYACAHGHACVYVAGQRNYAKHCQLFVRRSHALHASTTSYPREAGSQAHTHTQTHTHTNTHTRSNLNASTIIPKGGSLTGTQSHAPAN